MTKYAIVISLELDDVDDALDLRNEVEACWHTAGHGHPDDHITLHKDTGDGGPPYHPWADITPANIEASSQTPSAS